MTKWFKHVCPKCGESRHTQSRQLGPEAPLCRDCYLARGSGPDRIDPNANSKRFPLPEFCQIEGCSNKPIYWHHRLEDRSKNRREDLVAMCGSCHQKLHKRGRKLKMRKRGTYALQSL